MLTFPCTTKIYFAPGPTDMRKSFDGLSAIVKNVLELDPLSGALFVFCNRRRNRLKVLLWDSAGYWVFAKRLERGTFAWPPSTSDSISMTREELSLVLGGIDVRSTRKRRWYQRSPSSILKKKKREPVFT